MERNPYAPPQAAVTDLAPADDQSERPPAVALAIRLLWIALALGILGSIIDWPRQAARLPIPALVPLQLLSVGISIWFIRGLARGRNWVRILFFIMMLLGAAGYSAALWLAPLRASYIEVYTHLPLVGALRSVQFLLHVAAAVYLCLPAARRWFMRHRVA